MSNVEKPSLSELALGDELASNDDILDVYLEHYGVKGMKWGVINEDRGHGRQTSGSKQSGPSKSSALDDRDIALLKSLGIDPVRDSPRMEAKYGPGSLGTENHQKGRLTPSQKKVIRNVAIGVGVAGAMYLLYREGKKVDPMYGLSPKFKAEWNQYQAAAGLKAMGLSKSEVEGLSTKPLTFSAGSIFRRVSTEKESSIRPGGFYASPNEDDVARYKAILPIFWKQWGLGKNEGYVVNLKANATIKAPSPRSTFEMFKSMLNDEVDTSAYAGFGSKTKIRDLWHTADMTDDEVARTIFPQFALQWANESHPATMHFFEQLRSQGFNALVDMNDAGALSDMPMRIIDGSLFSIDSHEILDKNAIRLAQETIASLRHMFFATVNTLKAMKGGRNVTERADRRVPGTLRR